MEPTSNPSPAVRARTAGVFYLITIITGVFAELFVRGTMVVANDASTTASNILANESLYRLGLCADFVMLASYVVVTLLFLELFMPAGRSLSVLAAFFSLVGIAVLAVNCLNHVGPLLLLKGTHNPGAFSEEQLQSFALIALRLHSRGYIISSVFFGVYCLLIGFLAFRSGFLPRLVGLLMALGGLGFLINSFTVFLFPAVASRIPNLGLLGGIGELALCLWLIVMGVNVPRWNERSAEIPLPRT